MSTSIGLSILAITAVILVPVLAVAGVVSLAVWLLHQGKMRKLEIEEKERQAEEDRQILGLGSTDISPHLETMLDRLNTIERRLDYLEAVGDIRTKQGTSIPISPTDAATRHRPETERQQQ